MNRVLLIDDDSAMVEHLARLLTGSGHDVVAVYSGREALVKTRDDVFDSALIDLNLPDIYGLDVLQGIRAHAPATRCVIVSGDSACKTVVTAMRLGAYDYLEKPFTCDDVLEALRRTPAATSGSSERPASGVQLHSLERWANLVIRALGLTNDPKTLHEWSRSIGVSHGALRNWCHTAGLSARRSLLFARVLRAVLQHQATGHAAEDLLNVVDRRTLTKLLIAGGGTASDLPPSVEDFLGRQQLIENAEAVRVIRTGLGLMKSEVEQPAAAAPRRDRRKASCFDGGELVGTSARRASRQ